VRENEKAWSGISSLCYITLLFVVLSINAKTIISLKILALGILLVLHGLPRCELFLGVFPLGFGRQSLHGCFWFLCI
jgi:hypothetical protein